ncbi:hypothetical protein [Kitasatospora sp. NPDC059327]|uniref:hypothetical protein n=1 Tax=Kitasatospora sp. NPDC059327 TaxID=3346803 RepID=UPI003684206C
MGLLNHPGAARALIGLALLLLVLLALATVALGAIATLRMPHCSERHEPPIGPNAEQECRRTCGTPV